MTTKTRNGPFPKVVEAVTGRVDDHSRQRNSWMGRFGADRNHVSSAYAKDDWAKGFDLLVVHDDCHGAVKDNALLEKISKAHKAGVPAVFLHCAMHSYRTSEVADLWRELIGVKSPSTRRPRCWKSKLWKQNIL